jgi:hypothetical protein
MEVRLAIDDPQTYVRPLTIRLKQRQQSDSDLLDLFALKTRRTNVISTSK